MSDTTSLLVQLGLRYVNTGGVEAIKRDLTAVSTAARQASTAATASLAQATVAAQATAVQLYARVSNALINGGRTAFGTVSGWAASVPNQFRSLLAAVVMSPAASMLSSMGTVAANAVRSAGTAMTGIFSSISSGLSAGLGALARSSATALRASLGITGAVLRGVASPVTNVVGGFRAGLTSGAAVQSMSDSGMFRSSMNFLSDGLRNVTDSATSLAKYGLVALTLQLSALAAKAKEVVTEFVGVNERFQELEITIKSALRGADVARDMRTELAKITAMSPLPFEGIAELARALVVIPQTRGRIADQSLAGTLSDPEGFLKRSVLLVEKMLTFRPDKHVRDAVYSIREALGGEFRSLVRRFDIPVNLISQLAGRSVQDLKTDGNATMDALMKVFDKIITTGAIRERAAQPSVVWQNIKEQIGTVAALAVGDKGIYAKIQSNLGMLYDTVQELTRREMGPAGKEVVGTSLLDKYAGKVSDALSNLFDALKNRLIVVTEKILTGAGFGADQYAGVSVVERSFMAVKAAIEWLTENMPIMVDKAFNIFSSLIPLLNKIGSVVIDIVDSLSSLFAKVPLASLGMLFGPTRVGMVANAAGINPYAAAALGVATSGALVRGIGNFMPNYAGSGLRGFASSIGSSFATQIPTGVAGITAPGVTAGSLASGALRLISTLAVGTILVKSGMELGAYLADVIKQRDADRRRTINSTQDDFRGWLSQNPDKAQGILAAIQKDKWAELVEIGRQRDLSSQRALIGIGSSFGHLPPAVAPNQNLKEAVKVFGKAGDLIEAVASDKVGLSNIENMAESVVKAHKAGRLLVLQTSEQIAKVESVTKDLADRVANGAFMNLDDSLAGESFKGSLRDAYPVLARLQSSTEQSGSQHFKEAFEEAASQVSLLSDTWKQIDQFLSERNTTDTSAAKLASLLNNSTGLAEGQKALQENFQATYTMLLALKEAKMPLDTRLTAQGIPMKLGEALDHFSGILKELDSSSGGLSNALQKELDSIKQTVAANQTAMSINSVKAASTAFSQVADLVAKGDLFQGATTTELFERLRSSMQRLGPEIYNSLSQVITDLESSVPTAYDLSKETQVQTSLIAQEQKSAALRILSNYLGSINDIARQQLERIFALNEVAREVHQNSPSVRLSRPSSYTPRSSRNTSGPRLPSGFVEETLTNNDGLSDGVLPAQDNSSGSLGPLPTGEEIRAELDRGEAAVKSLKQQSEASKAAADKIRTDNSGNGLVKRIRDPQTSSGGSGGNGRSFEDRELDARVTNALQEVTSLLNAATRIEKEGPLAASYKEQFSKSIQAFPELAGAASTGIEAIFAAYKEGSTSVDTLHSKLKATLEFSQRLAAALDQRGLSERKKGNLGLSERFTDAATRMRSEMAEVAQSLYELEAKMNHPFKEFWKGMAEGVGSTKNIVEEIGRVGQAVGQTISKSLGSAFAGWVTGTKTAKEAFEDFTKSVIDSLAQMAAEAATQQLLGLLVNAAGSALTGTAGSWTGGEWASAASGGNVAGYNYSSASGFTAMASGGTVTGGSGLYDDVPIMAMDGEYVLSKKAVRAFGGAHRLDEINFMAEGGAVSRSKTIDRLGDTSKVRSVDSSGGIHINVPITFNGGNEETTVKQKKEMARQIENAVMAVVERQQRNGGILSN